MPPSQPVSTGILFLGGVRGGVPRDVRQMSVNPRVRGPAAWFNRTLINNNDDVGDAVAVVLVKVEAAVLAEPVKEEKVKRLAKTKALEKPSD